jgi:hypothetical protein
VSAVPPSAPSPTTPHAQAPAGQPPGAAAAAPGQAVEVPRELCPLCGSPLRPDQDWCLRCGAAARTRLAAPAKWKALALALTTIVAVALAVLIVALVKLAG